MEAIKKALRYWDADYRERQKVLRIANASERERVGIKPTVDRKKIAIVAVLAVAILATNIPQIDGTSKGGPSEAAKAVVTPAEGGGAPDPKAQTPSPKKQGVTSQWFGENEPSYRKFGVKGHTGIDIAADCGVPAFAPATGTITATGDDPKGYGHFIRLADYAGESILLGHFDQILVKQGQTIALGDQIATVGSTGNSSGCHVHFEVHPRNENPRNGFGGAVDPKNWQPLPCRLKNVPAAFGEYICAAAAKEGLNPALLAAIITYENRFNVKGYPDSPLKYPWPCSPAGACGPAQFIAPTWASYGVDGAKLYDGDGGGDGVADRHSFSDAIYGSARYLRAIAEKKPDAAAIAAEYNCGPKCGGPASEWPYETRDYVSKVTALRASFTP